MSIAHQIKRLRKRKAAGIFERASRDVLNDTLHKARSAPTLALVLSIVILALPIVLIIAGCASVLTGWPGPGPLIFGGILIGAGTYLLWPQKRQFDTVVDAQTMPQTFALIDQIGARMNAPKVTKLAINDEFNAFMTRHDGRDLIGFGTTLWACTTPAQREAIIAHELGHLVNGDVLRYGVTARSFRILLKWIDLIEPDVDSSVAGIIVQAPLALFFEALMGLLLRLTYSESQRAEYLADAAAAGAVGAAKAQDALNQVALGPIIARTTLEFHGAAAPKGQMMMAALSASVRDPQHPMRAGLLAQLQDEEHQIDLTHPPSRYRLAFLDAVADVMRPAAPLVADWPAIDAEWQSALAATGDRLHDQVNIQ